MEAALISFLLDKIGEIVVDQAQRTPPLDKIHSRIERITAELKVMKAFLEGYNWSTIAAANEQLEAWIEQVKSVALKVEDIIDGYLYLVGEQRERTWKDYLSRPKNLCCDLAKAWCGIDSRLEAIEKEILNLFNMRVRFDLRWQEVYDCLCRESEMSSIVNLCFNDLPCHLKNCLVYCSIFPENYVIKRKKLIRLWVAEGFAEANRSKRVMEEEAEDYLTQLVDRSMLQVEQRNDFGRLKAFRIHNVVRKVTLAMSRKADFCMILDGSQSVLDNSTRRLSIQTSDEFLDLNMSLSQLHSLIMFPTNKFSKHSLRKVLISSKMLRVLELENIPISKLPNEVSALFSLHYLGLRRTKVKQLPNNIQKLQTLQTIDLRDTRIKKLPHGVTQLKQLRHLFVSGTEVEFGGAWQWKNLQTLRSIKATMRVVQLLGDMKELRSLEIVEVKQAHCPQLCTSLIKMRKLRCLRLFAKSEEQLDFETINSPPPPLQKLDLSGRLFGGKMPTFICSCAELVRVRLLWSQLKCDPLPTLGKLDKLVVFILGPCAYEEKTLHFRTGWFLNLKRLYLGGLKNLNNIEIDEGAMASLHELVMTALPELKMVRRHINFLTGLHSLSLFGMREELVGKLRKHDKEGRQEMN